MSIPLLGRRLLFLIQDTIVGTLRQSWSLNYEDSEANIIIRGYLTATEEHEEGNDL